MNRSWRGKWDGDNPGSVFLRVVPLVVVESNVGPRVVGDGGVADGLVDGLGAVLEFVQGVAVRVAGVGRVVDRVGGDPFDADVESGVCVGRVAVSEWGFGADRSKRRSIVGAECFVAERDVGVVPGVAEHVSPGAFEGIGECGFEVVGELPGFQVPVGFETAGEDVVSHRRGW